MHVSEARLAANLANGLRGQGPVTAEGKAISRRNARKHGLTGQGVVVSQEERTEIDLRIESLAAELKPQTEAGQVLLIQMATLSVRAERAADHETAAIAHRVRHAPDLFDEDRIDQAEELFAKLPENPRNNLRRLRKSPEGVGRLCDAWKDLKADLNIEPKPHWAAKQIEMAGHLLGLRSEHAPGSRLGALSRALWGDFAALTPADGGNLSDEDRKAWAKTALHAFMDAEIAELEEHYLTLDFDTIDLDRSESGYRALFDASKPAILARRYEAEARRGFYKALKELRQIEAEAAEQIEAAAKLPPAPRPDPKMGSSREIAPPPPLEPTRSFPEARSNQNPTVQSPETRPMTPAGHSKTPG